MAPIVHRVDIDRRPEDVFDYVTEPSLFTEWQDAVVSGRSLDPEPKREGGSSSSRGASHEASRR